MIFLFFEIILAVLYLHILRCGTCNSLNGNRSEKHLRRNYRRLFGLRLPHLYMVNAVLEKLYEQLLDEFKCDLIRMLMTKHIFHKYRLAPVILP